MIGLRQIEEMQAEARYHRERYDLYKAKAYGPRLTSEVRLNELERSPWSGVAPASGRSEKIAGHDAELDV